MKNNNVIPAFKIVLRRCTGLAKTDSNGLTDCYIVGKFWDMRANKYLKQPQFKSSCREKTLEPVFDEVYVVNGLPGLHVRVDLECWDADQVGKDDFLGMHRIYLGQYDTNFEKYVPHRRDFATLPYVYVTAVLGSVPSSCGPHLNTPRSLVSLIV